MKIGNKEFDPNKTYVMGILNVTPDSFSDGGKYDDISAALFHTEEMIRDGAAIIDVGGESTRPGHTVISEEEEISRVINVIKAIKSRFDIPVSLDTYKTPVARAGLSYGADMINDIWGACHRDYPDMAALLSEAKVPCCLMHNKEEDKYDNFGADLISEMKEIADKAIKAGIEREKIILDPGVGFAKDTKENLIAIRETAELKKLGYPVLLGVSRKSVIGNTLNEPVDKRLAGTLATTAYGYFSGAMFIRVHDVKENFEVIKMLEEIENG